MLTQHENVRAIVSAVTALQKEPLTAKGRELLNTITRNANEAADEIEYLQTAASSFRSRGIINPDLIKATEGFPKEYDDCKFTLRERQFVDILYRAKQQTVVFETLMAKIYAHGCFTGRASSEGGVKAEVLKAFAYYARQKIAKHRDAIEKAKLPSVIETVWGVGFRLVSANGKNTDTNGKFLTCVK